MTMYEEAQAHLDRAYRAAANLVRETRPQYREIWKGHALKWAAAAERVCAEVVCDGVHEVRMIVEYN